jgi:hypothetical protein
MGLQVLFEVKGHQTTWWLRAGYNGLSVLFAGLTAIHTLATSGRPADPSSIPRLSWKANLLLAKSSSTTNGCHMSWPRN